MSYKTENERKIHGYIAKELSKKACNMCHSGNCTSCGYGNPLVQARAIVDPTSVVVNAYNEQEDFKVLDDIESLISEAYLSTLDDAKSIRVRKDGSILVSNDKLQNAGIPLECQFGDKDEIDVLEGNDWEGTYKRMRVDPSYS